jgi:hypothetical protein
MVADGSTIGGQALPLVAASSATATIADPALDIVLGYIRALFNRYAAAAWASVAPNEPIVRTAFTHDPQEYAFSVGHLPALYLFRTGSARNTEDIAEDIRMAADNVRLFWVLPPGDEEKQRRRTPIIQALGKLIDLKIKRTRDPAYVLASDPDPTKTAEGTVVMRAAGLSELRFRQWEKTTIAISVAGGTERKLYQALSVKLEFDEQLTQEFDDLTAPAENTTGFEIAGAADSSGAPLPNVPFAEFDSDSED